MLGRKIFSLLLGLVGLCLMVGTLVLCLCSLDAEPVLVELPKAAEERAEALLEAIAEGDYAVAAGMMQGQPDLGADRAPADEVGVLVWDAFVDSLVYTFPGDFYAVDTGLARDVTVTCLDISSVTENLPQRTQLILEQRVSEAEELTAVYEESGAYREDVISEVLLEAAAQALEEDAKTISRELTLKLVYQDDQWWVVPDQALLEVISGGVTG